MNFGNLMLAIDILSLDIVGWATVVIAVLGLCLFFSDLIINIKKRRNTRLNIIGLVFISLSLVCFLMTMLFSEMELIFMFIAIAFMIGYFVCDVIVAVCIAKQNKREGKPIWRKPKKPVVKDEAVTATDADKQETSKASEKETVQDTVAEAPPQSDTAANK